MLNNSSDNLRGAALMMASMAAFTFNDTFMKMIAGQVPLNQILFLRGVLSTVLIAMLYRAMGPIILRIPRHDAVYVGVRVFAEIGAAYFFLNALFNMPLANVSAILQSLPLTVTLAAAVFMGEPVGWRRMGAICVGFIGVMLIVRPGADGFSIYSIYALIAVAFVTLRDLVTRKLSRDTPSMLVTLYSSLGVTVWFGLSSLTEDWANVDARSGGLILSAALMIIGGYLFSIMVMRIGEISFVAPFRYTALLWALLLGWVAFDEWPDPLTLLGGAIVISSGLFMLYREGKIKRGLANVDINDA